MGTGTYLVFIALSILYSVHLLRKSRVGTRDAVVLGVLGGLTTWVRIDFGVVFLVFLTVLVLRRRLDVRWAIVTGCIAMAIISPWFLYVYTVTSSWLPPSGSAQSSLITLENAPLRLLAMGKALLSHLTPWIYSWSFTRAGTVASTTALLSLVAFLGYLFRQKDIVVFLSSWLKQQPHLLALLIGTSVLLVGYLVFFGAWNGYVRYTAPIIAPLAVIVAVAERIRALSKTLRLILLYALPVCFFAWAFLTLHIRTSPFHYYVTLGGLVQDHFSSVKVGTFSA